MLGLERANKIVDAALAEARRLGLAPLAVIVLDAGGNLVVAKREDGSGLLRIDIAHAKAWGSLGMGFGSRELSIEPRAPRLSSRCLPAYPPVESRRHRVEC
jgi:uncharacterized protein GlcG (DUF336 family)